MNSSTEQEDNAGSQDSFLTTAEQAVRLRAKLAEVCQALSEERASLQRDKKAVERLCAQLLIKGERIPALDQPTLSPLQHAYLGASTETIVASENILILQNQIASIEATLTQLAILQADRQDGDWLQAA